MFGAACSKICKIVICIMISHSFHSLMQNIIHSFLLIMQREIYLLKEDKTKDKRVGSEPRTTWEAVKWFSLWYCTNCNLAIKDIRVRIIGN